MKQIIVKLPNINEVQFKIIAHEEGIPIKGNAVATGNDEEDKEIEDEIYRKLESSIWAWCCIEVKATWKGIKGNDYLGCCSYEDEDDFIKNSGYFEDMKERAYSELIQQLEDLEN